MEILTNNAFWIGMVIGIFIGIFIMGLMAASAYDNKLDSIKKRKV